uniref:Uncharacterized protein n=1 Tax=Anguilla anguilla TaxID=7936 RepID=A0A0E9S4I2_ANGAN
MVTSVTRPGQNLVYGWIGRPMIELHNSANQWFNFVTH